MNTKPEDALLNAGYSTEAVTDILTCLGHAGFEIHTAKPAPKAKAKATTKSITGEAFFTALTSARYAAMSEHGPAWFCVPGACVSFRLPRKLATYHFTRRDGSKSTPVRNPRDYSCAPAPRFWPGGRIPDGVEMYVPGSYAPTELELRCRARMEEAQLIFSKIPMEAVAQQWIEEARVAKWKLLYPSSTLARAVYPMKSFVQTMVTDDMVSRRAGVLGHISKGG